MPSNITFENNEIYGVSGSGISLGSYTTDINIIGNYIHDIIPVDFLDNQLSVGVQTQFGQDILISENSFANFVYFSNN